MTLYVTLHVEKLINISIALGATVSNAIILIFPPLFYIMLSKHHFRKKLILPWFLIIIGFTLMSIYIYNYFFPV
jgi:amino acid permease